MTTVREMREEQDTPVVISDEQGVIQYVNGVFEDVFGWTSDEMVGSHLTRIIPESLHDAHNLGFSRFLTTEKPTLLNQKLQLRAVSKDGREFDAEHFIIAERQGNSWVFAASIQPSERG